MSSACDPSIESEVRNHAWNYFSLHAQQRMSAFQFFITLETGLIGLALFVLQSQAPLSLRYMLLMIGPLVVLLAFVFWKIDQRTRELIKRAEVSLREVEKYFMDNTSIVTSLPFTDDPQFKGMSAWPLLPGRLSYSQSFGVIFGASALIGLIITIELAKVLLR
jgi:cytochrome c oxidase subunit IV